MTGHRPVTARPISLGRRCVSHSEEVRDMRIIAGRIRKIAAMRDSEQRVVAEMLIESSDVPSWVNVDTVVNLINGYRRS